jgi:hypothetical protein
MVLQTAPEFKLMNLYQYRGESIMNIDIDTDIDTESDVDIPLKSS